MTPTLKTLLTAKVNATSQPSKNYKMHYHTQQIKGTHDGLSAMEQVVFKILNTQRYQYQIYSWNYGIELLDLFGQPISYVCAELQRRIYEALIQDDRIFDVDDFSYDLSRRGVVSCFFTVHTQFGDLKSDIKLNY